MKLVMNSITSFMIKEFLPSDRGTIVHNTFSDDLMPNRFCEFDCNAKNLYFNSYAKNTDSWLEYYVSAEIIFVQGTEQSIENRST